MMNRSVVHGLKDEKSTPGDCEIYRTGGAEGNDFLWTFSRRYFLLDASRRCPPRTRRRMKGQELREEPQARLIRARYSFETLEKNFLSNFMISFL